MPSRPRHWLPALLCALVPLASATGAAQACGAGQLQLEERQRIPLPPSAGIAGVLPSAAGALLLWTTDGRVLAIDSLGGIGVTPLPDSLYPVGLAPEETTGGFRLFDAGRAGPWRFGPASAGVAGHRYALDDDLAVDQALADGAGWLLLARDVTRRTTVLLRLGADAVTPLYRSPPAAVGAPAPRLRLSAAGETLLLTRSTAPFTVLRLDRRGAILDSLQLPALPIAAESLSTWRAQAAVALDCGVLLPLTNLAADRRLLLRFDAADRFRTLTTVDAPIGFVASRPEARELIAARRAGGLELVRYQWRWLPDHDLTSLAPRSSR